MCVLVLKSVVYLVCVSITEHADDDLHYNSKLMYTISYVKWSTYVSRLLLFSDAISHKYNTKYLAKDYLCTHTVFVFGIVIFFFFFQI